MTETVSKTPVHAEVAEDNSHVEVFMMYSPDRVLRIKGDKDNGYHGVPSQRFVSREKSYCKQAYYKINLDMEVMRRLREAFGDELSMGPILRRWASKKVKEERNLTELSQADDADLKIVPNDFTWVGIDGEEKTLRPFQRADIAFMASTNSINANQPGSGKTVEWLLALVERGIAKGPHVIFAPVSSLRVVWEDEINSIFKSLKECGVVKSPPQVLTGDTPDERRIAINESLELSDRKRVPFFFLVLNPAMAQMEELYRVKARVYSKSQFKNLKPHKQAEGEQFFELIYPELLDVPWRSMNIDEFHLMGLSNPTTLAAKGCNQVRQETNPDLLAAMSGTPMRGKPIKMWGALHFLDPEEFDARWRWAKTWLTVTTEQVNRDGRLARRIEGIAPGRDIEFYNHLKPRLVRRTKKETMPGLPEKVHIPVWCEMTKKQAEQYKVFETEAEWRIEDKKERDGRLSAPNVLAEYTRLKQFAGAFCDVKMTSILDENGMPKISVKATEDSGKLIQLEEKLAEENVLARGEDDDKPELAIIFSQSVPMVEMVAGYLERKHKIPVGVITGSTKGAVRTALNRGFQTQTDQQIKVRGKPQTVKAPRVMVCNTLAGGASVQLSRAGSAHILDELWVPDDQEQAEDRGHRGDHWTMAKDEWRIYYYRSKRTIESYIQKVNIEKGITNRTILDVHRMMQKANREVT